MVTKIVERFGCKPHLLVDVRHEVVLAFDRTDTKAGDHERIEPLVAQAETNLPDGRAVGIGRRQCGGSRRFSAHVSAVLIVHLACGTLLSKAQRKEGAFGTQRLSPIAKKRHDLTAAERTAPSRDDPTGQAALRECGKSCCRCVVNRRREPSGSRPADGGQQPDHLGQPRALGAAAGRRLAPGDEAVEPSHADGDTLAGHLADFSGHSHGVTPTNVSATDPPSQGDAQGYSGIDPTPLRTSRDRQGASVSSAKRRSLAVAARGQTQERNGLCDTGLAEGAGKEISLCNTK